MATSERLRRWQLWLGLGRVSNLPTVWSNCLAGWVLGGGGETLRFYVLWTGATLLYLGGMLLNDACDASFDQQHRPERPIPSGQVPVQTVWQVGFGALLLGTIALTWLGSNCAVLAAVLAILILVYDLTHKLVAFSPIVIAACRLLLYLIAGAASRGGIYGLTIWGGVALAGYVIGLSYVARRESTKGPLRWWPLAFLFSPFPIALAANGEGYLQAASWLMLILAVWLLRCLRHVFDPAQRNLGRAVAGMLAGIVWVDVLAVAGSTPVVCLSFTGLFLLALLAQRFAPAT